VLVALAVWSYLFNSRSVGMMHTLPLRREGVFFTSFLSGMVMMAIPYAVTGALCVLVLLLSGKFGMAIFLGVYILVAQQLDSNLLQPRLHGHSVGLKAIYVLLAITVGGGIGGFVGMLICVPVTAVLKELLNDYIAYRNRIKTEKAAEEEAV
jgi:predicted PurR-regulated permease PerM